MFHKAIDANGQALELADKVKIIKISDWLLENLDKDALRLLETCLGKTMPIIDIDEHGFIWLEIVINSSQTNYESHLFGLEPNCLIKP